MPKTLELLREHIGGLPIIDTHEHMVGRESGRDENADILSEYLQHYFSCDLISAGLSPDGFAELTDASKPVGPRFKAAWPYWKAARRTGYGRALDIAVKRLYGVDGLNPDTIEEADARFKAALKAGGHYERVFKRECNIRLSILDFMGQDVDFEFFRPTAYVGEFVSPPSIEFVRKLTLKHGLQFSCFDDYLEAVRLELEEMFAGGAPCYKSALAYQRSLHFPRTTYHEAEKGYLELLSGCYKRVFERTVFTVSNELENYIMHFILKHAAKHGRTMQVHTGIQEGNGNLLENSNPALLSNLFLEYPDVKFDIFHMSYPYMQVIGALCKNFPNVYIDMAWGHILSPAAAQYALYEWLDAVPANKISAFGGDYAFVDGVIGHVALARENVARSLARKVDDGAFGIDEAKEIAGMLFFDNPNRILNLGL